MGEVKHYTLIVNGTEKIWTQKEISYQQVVELAFGPSPATGEGITYTVTYTKGHSEHSQGHLSASSKSVRVKEGMQFDVVHTNRS